MIDKKVVSEMEDGRNKILMEILESKGKPYIKKHDGYAVKIDKDEQITYTDYSNRELTETLPRGSYIMVGEDSSCPYVVTEKEFNDSNKFVEESDKTEKAEKPKSNTPKIGMASLT